MIKAEESIVLYKLSERISQSATRKLHQNGVEFNVQAQKILQETLLENMTIISSFHRENLKNLDLNLEDIEAFVNHKLHLKLVQKLELTSKDYFKTLQNDPDESRLHRWSRYIVLLKP